MGCIWLFVISYAIYLLSDFGTTGCAICFDSLDFLLLESWWFPEWQRGYTFKVFGGKQKESRENKWSISKGHNSKKDG